MEITRVTPGDAEVLRAVWEVEAAAHAVDLPMLPADPAEEVINEPLTLLAETRERWVASEGSRAIGSLKLCLPRMDNQHSASVNIVVHPEHRRRGLGRALFDVALRRVREEGRTHVISEIGQPVQESANGSRAPTPGVAFATKLGAKMALAEMVRVLDLDVLSSTRLDALVAEATTHSGGYELAQWVGPAPDDLVDDLARLTSRLSTDAPMGDLEWNEEVWDGARFREAEAEAADTGRSWVTTAARHVESGRVVAYTDIGVSRFDPDTAHQWTTIVDGDHRGHRLGMLVKVANLHLLRRELPTARRIFTWNADSNEHMLAINKAMGFRPVATWTEWQLELSGR